MRRQLVSISAALALWALGAFAWAQVVRLDPAEGELPPVGEKVTFALIVEDITDLFGWQINLRYSSSVLEFSSFSEGDFLKQGGATFQVGPNFSDVADDPNGLDKDILVAFSLQGNVPGVSGSGTLATYEFTVVGEGPAQVELLNPLFLNSQVQDIPVTAQGALLTPPPPPNQLPVAEAGPDVEAQVGQTVSFNGAASSDPDGTIAAYSWDFGDGSTAEGVEVTHAYTDPGTYTVTLTVTDDQGATATDTLTVTVTAQLPPAVREHEAGSPTLQLEVQFPTAGEPAKAYIAVWRGEWTVEAGQVLEYQIAMFSGNPAFSAGVDLVAEDGTRLSALPDVVDQNGLSAAASTDLSGVARDQWYHRQIPLDALAGKKIVEIALGTETTPKQAGLFRAYVDNIQITDGTNRLLDVYLDGDNVPLPTPTHETTEAGAGGIENATAALVRAGVVSVAVRPQGKKLTLWGELKRP